MGELSWWHWLIVIAALVLLFGANKLPQMARSLGQSVRILRSETRAMNDEKHKDKEKDGDTAKSEQSASEQPGIEQRGSVPLSSVQAETEKREQA
jgi:sec-independent protein translocase protein TatA